MSSAKRKKLVYSHLMIANLVDISVDRVVRVWVLMCLTDFQGFFSKLAYEITAECDSGFDPFPSLGLRKNLSNF